MSAHDMDCFGIFLIVCIGIGNVGYITKLGVEYLRRENNTHLSSTDMVSLSS